jgi:hypothetical protein
VFGVIVHRRSAEVDNDRTTTAAGSLIIAIIMQPLHGGLSDKIGRKPILVAFGVLGTLATIRCSLPCRKPKPLIAFFLICATWTIVSGYSPVTAIVTQKCCRRPACDGRRHPQCADCRSSGFKSNPSHYGSKATAIRGDSTGVRPPASLFRGLFCMGTRDTKAHSTVDLDECR